MAELLLASGHTVLVDDADLAAVTAGGRWYLRRDGRSLYASRKMRREGKVREVTLHGFLTGWPRVDHINGNGLDNRRCNLRPATGSQNQANRHAPPYGSSKYRGVTWHKGARKWQALFRFEGRNRYLGLFVDEAEAARAFDRAAIEAWGDYARVNFPSAGTS